MIERLKLWRVYRKALRLQRKRRRARERADITKRYQDWAEWYEREVEA